MASFSAFVSLEVSNGTGDLDRDREGRDDTFGLGGGVFLRDLDALLLRDLVVGMFS